MEWLGGIQKFMMDGGAFMWIIAVVSVLAIGVSLERFYFLFFRFNINASQFWTNVQKLVMANNIDRAINFATPPAMRRCLKLSSWSDPCQQR